VWGPSPPPAPPLDQQPQGAGGAENVVTRQVAAAHLPQARERVPAVQDAPVVDENHLRGKHHEVAISTMAKFKPLGRGHYEPNQNGKINPLVSSQVGVSTQMYHRRVSIM